MKAPEKKPSEKKKFTSKQAVALSGAALLLLLYLAALVAALTDKTASGKWFMLCIYATVAVPILIWIYTWIYGKLTGRRTIADAAPKKEESSQPKKPKI